MEEGVGSSAIVTADKQQKVEEQNLLVALRIRPMNEDEIIQAAIPIAYKVGTSMVVIMDPMDDPDDVLRVGRSREKQYVFDITFDGSSTQAEVYEKICKFLIPSVFDGYSATVFAYGATGAGKTYTMLGTDNDPGVMGRALTEIFESVENTSDEMSYQVTMSYLEIYNEMIRDLLNPSSGFLDIREDSKGVQVAGLSEVTAKSTFEVMSMLTRGNIQRTQEPTAANKTSSRSHAILQIIVRQQNIVRGIRQEVKIGRLFLTDLAGSERASHTQNKGKRMVEGAHINRSLLALGNCINALSGDRAGVRYVNYRDSKLTRLLKDALGGNCKTVMLAHISPASIHFEESRNTLVYADRAKQIKTKVTRNVMDVTYHISQYTNIISELQDEVKRLRHKMGSQTFIKHDTLNKHSDQELLLLKDQLLAVFKEQMKLRRTLMELNNSALELSLQAAKYTLIIKKVEHQNDNKMLEIEGHEKTSETIESAEVAHAREELKSLQHEVDMIESNRIRFERELDLSKETAATIEERLPEKITSRDQQELLSLLCKVHELEIENVEMQSSIQLRNFDLRRRDLALSQFERHKNLADQIIQHQRVLISDNHVETGRELDELYDIYRQEAADVFFDRSTLALPDITAHKSVSNWKLNDSDSIADTRQSLHDGDRPSLVSKLPPVPASVVSPFINDYATPRKSNKKYIKPNAENQLFSKVVRDEFISRHGDSQPTSRSSKTHSEVQVMRERSLITLDSHHEDDDSGSLGIKLSNSSVAQTSENNNNSGLANSVFLTSIDREHNDVIAQKTSSIAALAMKRRSKAQIELLNQKRITDAELSFSPKSRTYLTKSTANNLPLTQTSLAAHDQKYNFSPSQPYLDSNSGLPPSQNLFAWQKTQEKKSTKVPRSLYRPTNQAANVVHFDETSINEKPVFEPQIYHRASKNSQSKPESENNIQKKKKTNKHNRSTPGSQASKKELGRKANGLVPLSDRDLAAMQATHKEQKAAAIRKLNEQLIRTPSTTSTGTLLQPKPTIPSTYVVGNISVTGQGFK